jgi:hypothetical protein
MSGILLSIAAHFIAPISGILATRFMDVIDDGLKLTANWPDTVKRGVVLALASVLPLVATAFPQLQIPTNPADMLTQPFVQSVIAFVIALVLKTHTQAKATVAPPAIAAK